MSSRVCGNPCKSNPCGACVSNPCGDNSDASLIEQVKKLCNDDECGNSCNSCGGNGCNNCCERTQRYDPGISVFRTMITPVSNLTPIYAGPTGSVEFRMRRKNKVVTLQWEPFTGQMAASGVAFLQVVQSVWGMAPYVVATPIYINYKGVNLLTHIEVGPNTGVGNIRFYLNTDGSATNITLGDAFTISGGCVNWVVD